MTSLASSRSNRNWVLSNSNLPQESLLCDTRSTCMSAAAVRLHDHPASRCKMQACICADTMLAIKSVMPTRLP